MPRRIPTEPITEPFRALCAEALIAYELDASYAISMATRAVIIQGKQATHRARSLLKLAEGEARAACEATDTFTCSNPLPCGVGPLCRFSTGELRTLEINDMTLGPMRGGKLVDRPQPGPTGERGSYNVESAVYSYRDRLEGSTQPA